jgi:hypothetical protein
MTDLLRGRSPESRPGADGQDDYDVIGADGMIIGRIFKATRFPNGMPWQWSLAYGHHEDHTPTHGYDRRARKLCRHSAGVGTEKLKRGGCQATAIAGIPT